MTEGMQRAATGAVVLCVIIVGLIYASVYTVDQGERGVVLRNGALVATAEPGMSMKMPFIDSVVKISVQSRSITYNNIEAYSKDQQPAVMVLSVMYRIPTDQVGVVYTQFGSEEGLVSRLVERKLLEESKSIFGQFTAVSAIQERAKLNQEISNAVRTAVEGPVIIDSIQVEDISYSNAYESSVEQRMLAEVEVQKLRQNADREKVQAEIVVTQAQAQADAVRARAMAESDAIKLRGEAEASAITARAKALADNPNLIELVKAEKWDGKLPTTMVPQTTVPFINIK